MRTLFAALTLTALASPALPFLPLLAPQILLNNFLSDVPWLAIATDKVDSEQTRVPRRWDIAYVRRFMVTFGLVSSLFDLATFAFLILVAQATAQWMPNAPQLEEIVHRRRASGTAVTSVFTELLGLDLHPRLVRDAKNLWAALLHHRGAEGRDAVWGHPDMLPTAAQLADPLPFAAGQVSEADAPEDDLDAELRKLLGG